MTETEKQLPAERPGEEEPADEPVPTTTGADEVPPEPATSDDA